MTSKTSPKSYNRVDLIDEAPAHYSREMAAECLLQLVMNFIDVSWTNTFLDVIYYVCIVACWKKTL